MSIALGLALAVMLPATGRSAAGEHEDAFIPAVKEVTIFKDGHVLVLRSGQGVPRDGELVTTVVPEPVLGTFFAMVDKSGPQIAAVNVGWRNVQEEVPCTTMAEILAANPGKGIVIRDKNGEVRGTLLPVGERKDDAETAASPPGTSPYYDYRRATWIQPATTRSAESSLVSADFVGVRSADGVSFVKLANVESFRIEGGPVVNRTRSRRQRTLSVRFDRDSGGKPVQVSFVSVEKGIRWIPEYRIEAPADAGKARVRLQATVINDILDLDGVRANLVVGVPSFPFGDRLSPMALADAPRQLSAYFAPPGGASGNGSMDQFSNAIMTQVAMPSRSSGTAGPSNPLPESVMAPAQATDAGDLYVYHVDKLTLAKGDRGCLNLWDEQLSCSHVYAWQASPATPKYVWRQVGEGRRQELEARLAEPKVMHMLRLSNTLDRPLTTGPAAIFRDGQILGQELVTYTAPGGSVDVPITVAVNVNSSAVDEEVNVVHNAASISGSTYSRAECRSRLRLVNSGARKITVSVTRRVPGKITAASDDGTTTTLVGGEVDLQRCWPWYGHWSWPWWWWRANSVSEVSWQVELEPKAAKEVSFEWNYLFIP
jgi:hypothetical protein